MTDSAPGFDFRADQHLYVLMHATEAQFQLRANNAIGARWKLLNSVEYDLDKSTAAIFYEQPVSSQAMLELRKLATPHKAARAAGTGVWYEATCLPRLLGAVSEFRPAAIHPLRVIVPKDPVERAGQEEEETIFRDARKAVALAERVEERRQYILERDAAEATSRERAARAERLEISTRLRDGNYLSSTHRPDALLTRVKALFGRVNELCGGFCELDRSKLNMWRLNYYVRDADAGAVSSVIAELREVLVVLDDTSTNGEALACVRPVGHEERTFVKTKTKNVSHKCLTISTHLSFSWELMTSLAPGIRGWDLSKDAAVFRFDPTGARGLGRDTPPKGCVAKDTWDTGTSCVAPEVSRYFAGYGISLGWAPGNLRFIAKSPFLQDEGAPLLLLRLVRLGAGVGIQKIRLDTGVREILPFADCVADNAIGSLWRPKSQVFVVTCLEDAMAINALRRKPCIVVPSAQALAELDWPEGATSVTALLPAKDPEPWIAAVAALRARAGIPGAQVRQMFPLARSSCPGFPFPAEWAWQCLQNVRKTNGAR